VAEDRADIGDLPSQPFLDFNAAAFVLDGIEAAEFPAEIHEDSRRFEHRNRLAAGPVGIDDGRHAVVRRDRQKIRRELIALADIDVFHLVGNAEFLQHDGDLPAVRRRPVIQLYRAVLRLGHANSSASAGS
jgi:hypothetical protein